MQISPTRLKSLNGLLTDIATLAVDEKIKSETIHPLQQIIKKLIPEFGGSQGQAAPKGGVVKLNLGIDSLDKDLQLLQYWYQISLNPQSSTAHSLFCIYMVTLTLKT
jgi:hypothetical protein